MLSKSQAEENAAKYGESRTHMKVEDLDAELLRPDCCKSFELIDKKDRANSI